MPVNRQVNLTDTPVGVLRGLEGNNFRQKWVLLKLKRKKKKKQKERKNKKKDMEVGQH
jgi:hypothetical protein